MKPRLIFALPLILLIACSSSAPGLDLREAWVRPANEGMNTAAYFIIENRGADDRLLKAEATIADRTEIHRSYLDDEEVMRMEQQNFVTIPENAEISFEPGGFHIMFIELKRDLVEGESVQLRLVFEKQGEVIIDAPVQNP